MQSVAPPVPRQKITPGSGRGEVFSSRMAAGGSVKVGAEGLEAQIQPICFVHAPV